MKKFLLIATLVNLSAIHSAQAIDSNYIKQASVDVCKAIQSDNKAKLNKTLKTHRLSYELIAEKLRCNGHDVMTFAAIEGASHNAKLLAKKSGRALPETLVKH